MDTQNRTTLEYNDSKDYGLNEFDLLTLREGLFSIRHNDSIVTTDEFLSIDSKIALLLSNLNKDKSKGLKVNLKKSDIEYQKQTLYSMEENKSKVENNDSKPLLDVEDFLDVEEDSEEYFERQIDYNDYLYEQYKDDKIMESYDIDEMNKDIKIMESEE